MSPTIKSQDLPAENKRERAIRDRYTWRFYSTDREERRHIHVIQGSTQAKYWLEQEGEVEVSLAVSVGFEEKELAQIEAYVTSYAQAFIEQWDRFFGPED